MYERIVFSGELGDADDGGGLREGKFADILAEIGVRGRLNTIRAVGVINGIQVSLQNLLFGITFFKVEGAEDFLHLSFNTHGIVAGHVLDELLGDGGTALLGIVNGTNRLMKAPNVRFQSTPWCSMKRLSSIAISASTICLGIWS